MRLEAMNKMNETFNERYICHSNCHAAYFMTIYGILIRLCFRAISTLLPMYLLLFEYQ